jgi:hypothetical protein
LCWQTVEQQFIPALAGASAVSGKARTRKRTYKKMNKKTIFIIIGLTFLGTGLVIGIPFEFMNVTADEIATYSIMLLFLLLFILLFRQIRQLENKIIKWVTFGALSILAIPYSWIGIMIIYMATSNYHPVWQDISVYTNAKNEKVISQFCETSGSIYDYRDRKIIADYGQFRLSFNCKANNLKGTWTVHNIAKNTTTTVNFDSRKQ